MRSKPDSFLKDAEIILDTVLKLKTNNITQPPFTEDNKPQSIISIDKKDEALEALQSAHQAAIEELSAKAFITQVWGKRCKTKDTDDFPEVTARCGTCEMWEYYDEWQAKNKSRLKEDKM